MTAIKERQIAGQLNEQQINALTVDVYYIRALITAASVLANDLTASVDGVEGSREAFDLGAILDISNERLTAVAQTLSP